MAHLPHPARQDSPTTHSTHIHDLPDETLIDILRHLSLSFHGTLPIRRRSHQDLSLQHPLQCALVCRRWRSLADSAVCSLQLSRSNPESARHLSTRFPHLSTLTLSHFQNWPHQRLITLANNTPHLEQLNLITHHLNSSVPALADALSTWTRLTTLNLGHYLSWRSPKDVNLILDSVCNLPSLKHLAFSFEEDPLSVFSRLDTMTGLATLRLDCPSPPPASSRLLPSILRELALRNLEGARLPESLGSLSVLEALTLDSAQKLAEIPDSLKRLSRLTRLEVVKCARLASLPASLSLLTSLKSLRVEDCHVLHAWPEGTLGRLTNLERATIDRLSGRFPEDIGDLDRLRELDLRNGRSVFELPGSMGFLRRLQVLRLTDYFSLASLPAELGSLASLKELELSNCLQLEALPESLGGLTRLEACRISHLPCLDRLPEGVGEWRALTRLEVSMCFALRELPDGLGRMGSLKELVVDWCSSLTALPRSLGALGGLRALSLTSCEGLTTLPESLAGLTGLRLLEVMHCDSLGALPEGLEGRTGLRIERIPC